MIQQINLTTNANELYVSSLLSENMGNVLIQETITGNLNNITMQTLLGSGNTDLTIGTLRRFVGNSFTINAILKNGTNYNDKAISITINLPTEELPGTYENEYILATSAGKTITAAVKNNQQNVKLANMGIINTISNIFGQIPKAVSTNGEHGTHLRRVLLRQMIASAAIAELAGARYKIMGNSRIERSNRKKDVL